MVKYIPLAAYLQNASMGIVGRLGADNTTIFPISGPRASTIVPRMSKVPKDHQNSICQRRIDSPNPYSPFLVLRLKTKTYLSSTLRREGASKYLKDYRPVARVTY